MMDQAARERLIHRIFESAIDDPAWSCVMEGIGDLLGGSAVTLADRLATERAVTILGAERIDPSAFDRVAKDYTSVETNPRLRYQHMLPVGGPISRSSLVDDDSFRRSWFYNDILRRADLFHELIISLRCDDVSASAMSVLRPERSGAYDAEDHAALREIIPHLRSALEIRTRLRGAMARRSGMLEVLDRMPWGVFLLSGSGQVMELNHRARQIVGDADELILGRTGLHAAASGRECDLRRLIADAATRGVGAAMSLPRRRGGQPLSLFAAPLAGPPGELCPVRAAAALFVSDPDLPSGPLSAALGSLYGLTPAETSVAIEIAGGAGLDAVAARLGVAKNTAKTHLNRVFEKTGTRRQAELARLLLAAPAIHGNGGD